MHTSPKNCFMCVEKWKSLGARSGLLGQWMKSPSHCQTSSTCLLGIYFLKNHHRSQRPQHFKSSKSKASNKPPHLAICFLLVFCVAYALTLKIEAICSSETRGSLYSTQLYHPKHCTLHSHYHSNLKCNFYDEAQALILACHWNTNLLIHSLFWTEMVTKN